MTGLRSALIKATIKAAVITFLIAGDYWLGMAINTWLAPLQGGIG